eukprot:NODE_7854_length_416_cov_235.711911.p1 GENE.NODE_7854_length_416_cov_235.711911~~NODE_7854_length_416_cov_235.711911.p1  ORF type:complete len:81 (+),score=13.41 NODE_7854_length_416_cov_235.711911:3-245(+)
MGNETAQAVQQAQTLANTVKHLCGQVADLEHNVMQLSQWKEEANKKLVRLRDLHQNLAEASSSMTPSETYPPKESSPPKH